MVNGGMVIVSKGCYVFCTNIFIYYQNCQLTPLILNVCNVDNGNDKKHYFKPIIKQCLGHQEVQ